MLEQNYSKKDSLPSSFRRKSIFDIQSTFFPYRGFLLVLLGPEVWVVVVVILLEIPQEKGKFFFFGVTTPT